MGSLGNKWEREGKPFSGLSRREALYWNKRALEPSDSSGCIRYLKGNHMDSETPEKMVSREKNALHWLTDKAKLVNIKGVAYLAVHWVSLVLHIDPSWHWKRVNLRTNISEQERAISLFLMRRFSDKYIQTQISSFEKNEKNVSYPS